MRIEMKASEAGDGTYVVRTQSLHSQRHLELEIIGIPRPAVEAAAKLIEYVAECVIERGRSRLKDRQTVGFPLTIEGHDDVDAVFIAVRAVALASPSGGFFARMRRSRQDALRLADIFDSETDIPRTAVATVMLYRANCRMVSGDRDGAVGELKAAIELMPGARSSKRMPRLDTGNVALNWQNHLSYLRLAELVDEQERAALLRDAYSRFEWLAMDRLGATVGELAALNEAELAEEAMKILEANRRQPLLGPGPHGALRFVASPIWTPGPDGTSVRMSSVIPAGFVDYCYGDHLQSTEVAEVFAILAASCVARFRSEPWRLEEMTSDARVLYLSRDAPTVHVAGARHPAHTMLSAIMAEAGRYLRAAASLDEVRAAFGLASGDAETEKLRATLAEKVRTLETWELTQYRTAIVPS